MKKRVLVVSSANMDMTLPVAQFPEAGQTVIAEGKAVYSPGGKGANSAVAFARLGAESVFCTRLGRDSHGETLYGFYKECGIDTSHIAIDKNTATGFAAIFVDPHGQNRILCYPGANRALTEEDIDDAFLCCPDALYMQMEIADEAILYAADHAYRHSIPIFLDAGPARADFPLEKLPPLEIFSPNETEVEIFTGIKPQGMQNCLVACMELCKRVRAKYVVLKLGSRGSVTFDGRHLKFSDPFPVHAKDTTAAGDAFTAALTLRYLENGGEIVDACRYANAVGGITVSRPGAAYSIPDKAEVEELLRATQG